MRIGIDLGGTKIAGIVLGEGVEPLHYRRIATPADYDACLQAVVSLIHELEALAGEPCSVGIGTPGSISRATGLMKNCNSTWLNGRALQRDLEQGLGQPVRVANDANCFALSEAVDGAGAGAQTVFGVIIGTGVGGGVVVNGQVLEGPNGIAGEWGHNPMPLLQNESDERRACYCGQVNCVETWLSGAGVARSLRSELGREVPTGELPELLQDPSRSAAYAARLARGLTVVINCLDPDIIVLGGGLSGAADLAMQVETQLKHRIFSDSVLTRVVTARFGDDSGVRGAARLW